MISVISAGSVQEIQAGAQVVARTARVVESPYLAGMDIALDHAFDDLFNGPLDDAVIQIVDDLIARSSGGEVVYLLPENGLPGDITVQELAARTDIVVLPGVFVPDAPVLGRVSIVDALEIALAENAAPFDRGLCPIDPTTPLMVTNWYGESVVRLALQRLARMYGASEIELAQFEAHGRLVIPPVDPLDGPSAIAALEHITARLRRPDGCPWDREQTRETLLSQFIEELDEFAGAINAGDIANQCEELGDVLFHVVAQCQLAAEAGDFTLDDVLRGITAKLVRRHPHVFGDVVVETYDDVLATWNRIKAEEKAGGRQNQARL